MRALSLVAWLLPLVPMALAGPLYARQNTTSSPPNATTTATAPSVTIYPQKTGGEGITITGTRYSAFQQDVYLGIPFAEPPVGDLRWTPPQAPEWNTTSFSATQQPPACLQNPNGTLAGSYGISEDCLYLNVFTPAGANATSAYLPVFVWVYGGGFTSGSSSYYNATLLMLQGISTDRPFIFVSLNYRLGVLGFGYGEEIAANGAANLGIKDVALGLQWVQENIWAFGGNPDEVTVGGQSAGAISISLLYLQPQNKLFRGAIMESGAQSVAPLGPTATTWQEPYDALVTFANCSVTNTTAAANQSTFECLKGLPAEQLLAAQLSVQALPQFSVSYIYGPSIDGDFIPDSPNQLLRQGDFAQIPFISGNNKDEGTGFIPTAISSEQQIEQVISLSEPTPPDNATINQVLSLYPNEAALGSPFGTGNETFGLSPVFKQASAIYGDATFQASRRWFLESAGTHYPDLPTWTYFWNVSEPDTEAYEGVPHGAEVMYIFGAPQIQGYGNYTDGQKAISIAAMNYWINFVIYNDPSPANSPVNVSTWPTYGYNQGSRNMLQCTVGNATIIQDDYRQNQIEFFNQNPTQFNLRRNVH